MVQPLLRLDKLWSWASISVGGLPVAIALPVLEATSLAWYSARRERLVHTDALLVN